MATKSLVRLNEIQRERERRGREALRIYRPMPHQLDFHLAGCPEKILRGGKRSGKSTAAAMEFASIVTGQPIIGPDGNPIQRGKAYPTPTTDDPRIYWIIGWDTRHIGETIYKLLFERGMGGTLKTIQDLSTGEWRMWNRASAADQARAKEAKLAEPLIPERFIKKDSWDWESKTARQFKKVELINGAKIFAYPSSAKNPKQGDAVSGIWIDEDIQFPQHLKEWQDRLPDMRGWFLWSVWPHTKNNALLSLLDRAAAHEDEPDADIRTFQLIMSQNEYLEEEGKRQSLGRMESEEEIARRDRGDLLMDTLSMYDFAPGYHLLPRYEHQHEVPKEKPRTPLELFRKIWTVYRQFPREWTRYLSIDPSHTRTACHSWVVPPPEWEAVTLGNWAICEWELIVKKHSAPMLAKSLLPLMQGKRYEAFIMDQNMGRQTSAGQDKTVFDTYANAFHAEKILSRTTHSNFVPGVNMPATRYRAVRELLDPSRDPRLIFCYETTIATQREFNSYRKKMITSSTEFSTGENMLLDEPANPRIHDAMASTEYFAAYILPQFLIGQAYVEPSMYGSRGSPAYHKAQQILKKQTEQTHGEYVHLGPGYAA